MTDRDYFRIRDFVAEFDSIGQEYAELSSRTRSTYHCDLDVPYGGGARQKLDLFYPNTTSPSRPVSIFIHGGYWRAGLKEDYSFVANTICSSGAIAAVIEYSLIPNVRMADIANEVETAVKWVFENASSFGGDPNAITVCGHSAGAHLSSLLLVPGAKAPTPIRSALLLSGLFDLEPISRSFLQVELHLTADEVRQFSTSAGRVRPETPIHLVVGASETPPFLEQSEDFRARLSENGNEATLSVPHGLDHMTIVRELAFDTSDTARQLSRLIAASVPKLKENERP